MIEAIIIGGGLMRSAAAWQLSRAGVRVLLLEQQAEQYTRGSSYGNSRITRSLGPPGDIFSWLNNTSLRETELLIEYLNRAEDGVSYQLSDIYRTSPVNYLFYPPPGATPDHLLINQPDQIAYAGNPEEARELFDMHINEGTFVIRENKEWSGTLNPGRLIQYLHRAIRLQGGVIQYRNRASSIQQTESGFAINVEELNKDTVSLFNCENIILAGGPYISDLLENMDSGSVQFSASRVALGFYTIEEKKFAALDAAQVVRIERGFPVIDFGPDLMYAMIDGWPDSARSPILKIGGHNLRTEITNLESVWSGALSGGEQIWGKKALAHYFKQLNILISEKELEFENGYSCVYTLTDNEIPVVRSMKIDSPGNLVVIGGMSGVGAKGTLAYGLIAADLLTGREEKDAMYQKAKAILYGTAENDPVSTFIQW